MRAASRGAPRLAQVFALHMGRLARTENKHSQLPYEVPRAWGSRMPRERPPIARCLPVQWEELTATDFPAARKRAEGVCILPMGVIEKHGPHLPLGTDVMVVRTVSLRAAQREYAVVFPEYHYGQICEAKHQPGCVAIYPELMHELLQNVCDEIARNGFRKILLVNGHGGSTHWLHYFCHTQLAKPRSYMVYFVEPHLRDARIQDRVNAMRKTDRGGHACEVETSSMLAIRPDLVQLDRASSESGLPLRRLKHLPEVYSAMWWYADYPNHYAGDARPADAELGEVVLDGMVKGLVEVVRAVKRDGVAPELQDEFHRSAEDPLKSAVRRTKKRSTGPH